MHRQKITSKIEVYLIVFQTKIGGYYKRHSEIFCDRQLNFN